jgi:hypothetical protein
MSRNSVAALPTTRFAWRGRASSTVAGTEATTLFLAENATGTATALLAVTLSAGGVAEMASLSMAVGLGGLWDFIKEVMRKFGLGLKAVLKYVKYLVALGIAFHAGCWIVLIEILIECGDGQTAAEKECRCRALEDQPAHNFLVWNVREDAKKMGCEWAKD